MEQVCKLCKKSFLSGRVLGGHMRCHGAKKSAKTEKNIKMCRAHSEVEDDDYAGYGLRLEKVVVGWIWTREAVAMWGMEKARRSSSVAYMEESRGSPLLGPAGGRSASNSSWVF
ncbi:hypothetical protein ACFX1Q_030383 [Malus domestica]